MIKFREDELFNEWSQQRLGFVADGVVDEEAYKLSGVKLLFVLKEVNDPEGGGWDLRDFIRAGGRAQTWDNVARWVHGVRNLTKSEPDYSTLFSSIEAFPMLKETPDQGRRPLY